MGVSLLTMRGTGRMQTRVSEVEAHSFFLMIFLRFFISFSNSMKPIRLFFLSV